MTITDDIIAARNCGVVRCGLSSRAAPSLAELATEFGLAADPARYTEIDALSARRLVEGLLREDLAYGAGIMPAALAAHLAERFFLQFGTDGLRCFTNGTFAADSEGSLLTTSGLGREPMTDATFDSGVLVIAPEGSGCFWVEDED